MTFKIKLKKKLGIYSLNQYKVLSLPLSNLKKTYYGELLKEKQKLQKSFGLSYTNLLNYYRKIKQNTKSIAYPLILDLQKRLDWVLYRLNVSTSLHYIRQLINHKHILVNNKIITYPAYTCTKNDVFNITSSLILLKVIKYFYRNILVSRLNLSLLFQLKFFKKHLISNLLFYINLKNLNISFFGIMLSKYNNNYTSVLYLTALKIIPFLAYY